MKRDHKIEKNWRQLEIAFPVPIAPPTFASPKAAYDYFTKHEDEFPDVDYSEPNDSDLNGSVSEFGQDALDAISGVMSAPFIPASESEPEPSPKSSPEPSPEPSPESSPEV